MERITIKHLRALCNALNRATNSPMEPWTAVAGGEIRSNVGNYHIDQAYGGYQLNRMMNEGGGVTAPLGLGFGTARECYDKMRAYMAGYQDASDDRLRMREAA